MLDSLDQLFTQYQFHKIKSNIPTITLYVQYNNDSVSVVQLLDFMDVSPISGVEFSNFKQKAIEYMKGRGYETVNVITLILTPYINECKKYLLDDNAVWILDTRLLQLIVYENQIEDFCNLRGRIEDLCVARGGHVSGNPYVQTYPKKKNKSFVAREFTIVNSLLVIINVALFTYYSIIGSTLDIDFMLDHGVMYVPKIMEDGEYFRFITCMFLHFGFQHLIGNMVVLLFLGDNVERTIGWWKYLLLYIGSGVIGSLGSFVYAYTLNPGIVSAGASGAIYGVIGALLWLVICNKGKLENMTIVRVCVMIAYALYSGFTSEHIDMAAHICGLVGGFLLAIILYRKEKVTDEDKYLLRRERYS